MIFDEFKIIAKGMKAVYTSNNFLPDSDSVKVWFRLLQDLDAKVVNAAVQKYMLTNKFPPTIADVREMSLEISGKGIPEWCDGWEEVLKAIKKYGSYNIKGAMDSFSDITRMCVERIGFRNICMSENLAVDRANFRMMYETYAERQKKDAQIPQDLKKVIQQIQDKQLMIEERN